MTIKTALKLLLYLFLRNSIMQALPQQYYISPQKQKVETSITDAE